MQELNSYTKVGVACVLWAWYMYERKWSGLCDMGVVYEGKGNGVCKGGGICGRGVTKNKGSFI